jgi:hypothetical protein
MHREARTARHHSARHHALAVLRLRDGALAVALTPAAVAVVAWAAGAAPALRWATAACAAAALALAAATALLIARARPAVTPTVAVPEPAAPALHSLIRGLAAQLDVPPPAGIALTPDCDCWLEEPPGRRAGGGRGAGPGRGSGAPGPVLVIGSPFLWWMRVGELRALLAPVVAGTGPSAHPDIAAARRCVRAWDAAVGATTGAGPLRRPLAAFAGRVAALLLRASATHSAEMERGIAAAASQRARGVDHGLRLAAQEQVGLAYAGWDRLLTRVALPAWRVGRWPRGLDAGVVAALTELSRRDRLADGFTARLGERPACDLLEEPGAMDEAVSLLAARLFHGGPGADPPGGAGWAPVDWTAYPEEVVDRIWRDRAARLFAALDALETPTLACALDRLTRAAADGPGGTDTLAARVSAAAARAEAAAPAAGPASPLPFPVRPPRGERESLAEHVAAAVCCAAADTTTAVPGLDWLDGPVLVPGGPAAADGPGGPDGPDGRSRPGGAAEDRRALAASVHRLVEDGDPAPLRAWLAGAGIRPDKPVRLV